MLVTVTAFIPEYQADLLKTWRERNHPFQFCGEGVLCETFAADSFDSARDKMARLLVPMGLRIKRMDCMVQPDREF